MKTVAVFVAVKRSDGHVWDLFGLADASTWHRVTTEHGILTEYIPRGAENLVAAHQPWVVPCFGGMDHDAIDLVLRSCGKISGHQQGD